MAADDVYILGIKMTKFGKHPDKDTVDLAAEATMAAYGRPIFGSIPVNEGVETCRSLPYTVPPAGPAAWPAAMRCA